MSSEAITKNDLAEILSKIPIATSENLPGIIKMFAGTFAPTGWLLCNGAEVAINDYPALYDVIRDTYGTPSDSDHFVLPDFRGRSPIGAGLGTASDATSRVLGQEGGSERVTLTANQSGIQAHTHAFTQPKIPNHSHSLGTRWSSGSGSSNAYTMSSSRKQAAISTSTDGGGGACTGGAVGAVTGGAVSASESHGNMSPYLTVNYIISTGGVSRWADSAGLPIVRDVTYGGQSIVNNETANIPTCYGKLVGLTDNYSLTNSTAKLPLTNFSGVGCSEYSNGIKVNESGVYTVSGTAYFGSGFTIDDIAHLQIWQNSTMLQDFGKRLYTASPYENLNVGPYIIELSENDVVYLYAYNQAAARGSVSYYGTRNFLMVYRVA